MNGPASGRKLPRRRPRKPGPEGGCAPNGAVGAALGLAGASSRSDLIDFRFRASLPKDSVADAPGLGQRSRRLPSVSCRVVSACFGLFVVIFRLARNFVFAHVFGKGFDAGPKVGVESLRFLRFLVVGLGLSAGFPTSPGPI